MSEHGAWPFPLVDRYIGIRMGVDLSALRPGKAAVVETPRRLGREQGYGYIRAFSWTWLADGRSAVSVPPGAGAAVERLVAEVRGPDDLADAELADRLTEAVNPPLEHAGLKPVDRWWHDVNFACNASLLRRHTHGDCHRLTDERIPPAAGLKLPTSCFPDGLLYGVVADGKVVSFAFSHRTGVMEDRIADLGVETAGPCRRRGYAQTCVSAVVEHVTRAGGEARYGCRPDNVPSIATARSVGFVPYGTSLVLSAPASDLEPPRGKARRRQ